MFDYPSRVIVIDIVSTDVGKVGEVGATVDDVLTISKFGVHSGRVAGSDDAASHREVLDQPVAEGTISWHIDAHTSSCCLSQRLHIKHRRSSTQEPESVLAPEDLHSTATDLGGKTDTKSTADIRLGRAPSQLSQATIVVIERSLASHVATRQNSGVRVARAAVLHLEVKRYLL
jgi:hypothetical protein